jgi:putative ABC transport system substrate-binding protein
MRLIRVALILAVSLVLAAPLASFAQQPPPRIARIGFLGVTSASLSVSVIRVEALRRGLRDLGYVEGKNLTIEFRWAEGRHERLPELAAELVGLKVDVIVSQGTQGASAAKQATATIPIVMPVVADPVDTGLVASLVRPGGNVTGLTWFSQEVSAKRLELLKDAVPRTKRVAVLSNPDNSSNPPILQAMELAARSLGLELQQFQARGPSELESAFAAMAVKRVDAVTLIEDAILLANATAIASLALKNRLPLIASNEHAEAGSLMAYGADFTEMFQRAAKYVDKILKGAKPGELPIERATKFDFVINLKTAKALGLTIPQSALIRADQVIE